MTDGIDEIHDALHLHEGPTGKEDKHGNIVGLSRCSCGMKYFGTLSEQEYRANIKTETSLRMTYQQIMMTEEWVWLGEAYKNIDSVHPKLFQKERKLWVLWSGYFYPLKTRTIQTLTIWKIAAQRDVPLSIVLENTADQFHDWVKENWKKWRREMRIPICTAKSKRNLKTKRFDEAIKVFEEAVGIMEKHQNSMKDWAVELLKDARKVEGV